jgi:hypothetical protein
MASFATASQQADAVASQGGSAEPGPPRRVNGADAPMEVAERSLAGGPTPLGRGEPYDRGLAVWGLLARAGP